MSDVLTCKLCDIKDSIYECPRCHILYCSVECYKSDKHLQCSELFYEQCVKQELAVQGKDPNAIQKMLEILKKSGEDEDENQSTHIDSDDEDDIHLADRLSSIDLEDSDSVWANLTPQERKDFKTCVQSGEIINILPEWTPWWQTKRKLITTADKEEEDTQCPTVPKEIAPLSHLTKMMPSLQVPFIIFNILLSYVCTARYFKGKHREMAVEATGMMLQLSDSLKTGKVFEDLMSSYVSFEDNVTKIATINCKEDSVQTTNNGVLDILRGDVHYIKAAICDMQGLMEDAISILRVNKNKDHLHIAPPTVKEVKICAKKLHYYLSWVEDYGKQLTQIVNYLPENM